MIVILKQIILSLLPFLKRHSQFQEFGPQLQNLTNPNILRQRSNNLILLLMRCGISYLEANIIITLLLFDKFIDNFMMLLLYQP